MVIVVEAAETLAIVELSPVHLSNVYPLVLDATRGTTVFELYPKTPSPGLVILPPVELLMVRVNGPTAEANCEIGSNNEVAIRSKASIIPDSLKRCLLIIPLYLTI
jgi:hypothetical protein